MARPYRQGVEYFPLDVYVDDKVKFLEAKYGVQGFGIYIKLLQKIYSCGYWYKCGEDEMLLLANEIHVDLENLREVIAECLHRELFSGELFGKYGILTSRGIQKRYLEMIKRRKDIEVVEEYTLVSELMSASCKHDVSNNRVNVSNNSENVCNNRVNVREREIEIDTETDTETETDTDTENTHVEAVYKFYQQHFPGSMTSNMVDQIQTYITDGMELDLILYAMELAIEANKRTFAYVKGTLNRWINEEILTKKAAIDEEIRFQQNKQKQQKQNAKPPEQKSPYKKYEPDWLNEKGMAPSKDIMDEIRQKLEGIKGG